MEIRAVSPRLRSHDRKRGSEKGGFVAREEKMSERSEESAKLARKVAERSIVTQATERLVYQIVEACAEHEQEAVAALRAENERLRSLIKKWMHDYSTCECNICVESRIALSDKPTADLPPVRKK